MTRFFVVCFATQRSTLSVRTCPFIRTAEGYFFHFVWYVIQNNLLFNGYVFDILI